MNNILIIGAGRSSGALINYVLNKAAEKGWFVTVADADPALAESKINGHPNGRAAWLDVHKNNDRKDLISRADIVVSLLPAHLHVAVAQDCIHLNKYLITASYVSKEMYSLGDEFRDRELIFMGEMGLDPGIDHMSAMQKIDEIKAKGGQLISFRSYTGGLIAPESDTNPWHYKFKPSAIAIHPRSGYIYLLASVGKILMVVDPASNQIMHIQLLNEKEFPQPEGMAFDANNHLLISSEGVDGRPVLQL